MREFLTDTQFMDATIPPTFAAPSLDRAAHLRATIDKQKTDPAARAIVFWRGKPLLRFQDGVDLARIPLQHPLVNNLDKTLIFLGLDGESPLFAADISAWEAPDIDTEAMDTFLDPSHNSHPLADPGDVFAELRANMSQLTPEDANIAASARAVQSWHDTHPFCAKCGNKTAMSDAGWRRDCNSCNAQHFPRTDPVVIALITHNNSVLLGRSPPWPEGMYSLLAGFVEPGESIEMATEREIFEEAGIRLGPVRYLASQPWPFPTSLMFGTAAEAITTEITLDPVELDDAKWVSKEDLLAAMAGENPDLKPARQGSIARYLLDLWVQDLA